MYTEAETRRADSGGFESVDDFVAGMLTEELSDDNDNFDYLFTPERIAYLDGLAANVREGGVTYTTEEVSAHLAVRREEWIRKNGQ